MEKLFKQFGLSTFETHIYQSLLALGVASVSAIAKTTGLKRTSCQEYLRSLEQQGLVNSTKRGNKYLYQAEDPDVFRQIVNERLFIVDRLLPELKSQPIISPWIVRQISASQAKAAVTKADRHNPSIIKIGDKTNGGAIINNDRVILYSNNEELPALEMHSSLLATFHRSLINHPATQDEIEPSWH